MIYDAKSDLKTIARCIGLFFLAAFMAAGVFGCIYFDFAYLKDLSETSATELMQSACLLITVLLFGAAAKRMKAGGLWLVTGFFLCVFIREQDAYFDVIFHGSWKYFALVIIALAFWKAFRCGWENTLRTLAGFVRGREYMVMMAGLATVLVFSRLIGLGDIWRELLGESFVRLAKNIAEEGTELWGYSLIAYSAVLFYVNQVRGKLF